MAGRRRRRAKSRNHPPYHRGRLWSDSRCTKPPPKGLEWRQYANEAGELVFQDELRDELKKGARSQHDYELRVASVVALMRRAAAGQLGSEQEIKPVRLHPEIWELRWDFGPLQYFRLYHSEPALHPTLLVALRFHKKSIVPRRKNATKEAQEREMELAQARHSEGRARLWGPPL